MTAILIALGALELALILALIACCRAAARRPLYGPPLLSIVPDPTNPNEEH